MLFFYADYGIAEWLCRCVYWGNGEANCLYTQLVAVILLHWIDLGVWYFSSFFVLCCFALSTGHN